MAEGLLEGLLEGFVEDFLGGLIGGFVETKKRGIRERIVGETGKVIGGEISDENL
jgi:hypothetical protein